MQQQPAPSQEEGVPPAAAAATASTARRQAVAQEQPPLVVPTPTVADDDDAPPAADAPLPLGDDEFPDIIIAFICRYLGLRELGRLACVARRFTEPTLTEPGGGGGAGGAKLSPIEEGARLQLAAGSGGGGGAAERLAGETWVRALWRVRYRLVFTSCGPAVVLSEEGALPARAQYPPLRLSLYLLRISGPLQIIFGLNLQNPVQHFHLIHHYDATPLCAPSLIRPVTHLDARCGTLGGGGICCGCLGLVFTLRLAWQLLVLLKLAC